MNKIRDILYDTNDILVALIIIAMAAFIVFSRVNAIMDYPEEMMAGQQDVGQIRSDITSGQEEVEPVNTTPSQTTSGAIEAEGETGLFSLFIGYGQSMDEVAQNLINLGFFETKDAFYIALDERGAASKVQAGTFIIPRNATVDEIIEIITKPGM